MLKQRTIFLSYIFVAVGLTSVGPAVAIPVETTESVALLGSPVAQMPLEDPVIKKAIESLQQKQQKPQVEKPIKPDTSVGKRPWRNDSKRYILGGPELYPM